MLAEKKKTVRQGGEDHAGGPVVVEADAGPRPGGQPSVADDQIAEVERTFSDRWEW